jgi:arsenite-transporting ATPase
LADVPRQADEPIGAKALDSVAEAAYGSADGLPDFGEPPQPHIVPEGDGYRYDLPLPGIGRDSLNLVRSGDELVVSIAVTEVDGHRRAFVLPATLRRCRIASARLEGGFLRVGFNPDETLWPQALLPENDAQE